MAKLLIICFLPKQLMKNFIAIIMMWLLGSGVLFAEIPKANLSVTKVNNQQWPEQYLLTLEIPKDHHAYLDAGDDHM